MGGIDARPAGRETDLYLGWGGLISQLFGRTFWLLVGRCRLSSIPIQCVDTARCRLSCRTLELSYNLHYVK